LKVSGFAAGTLVYDGLLAVGKNNVVQAELGPAGRGVAEVLVHALHGKKLSKAKRANRVLSTLYIVGHDAMLSTAVRMVAENRRRDIAAFGAKEPVVGGIILLGGEGEGGRRDANNTGYAPKVEMARMQQPRIFGRM